MVFFFQAEDGIRDLVRSRGLGDVYKRQRQRFAPDVDWTDFEDALGMQWINQLHLFNHAFYSVSYTHLTLPTSDLV